ncbi:MAG: hypothetical protein ACYTGN_14965 [Planctomycetota bacterium]
MKGALKAGVVIVPFLLVFLGLRACGGRAAQRWQARVQRVDPDARIVVDSSDLIVIANDEQRGRVVGRTVADFRTALIRNYGDLLGEGREQRMVVVLFSDLERLQRFEEGPDPKNVGRAKNLHGFTVPSQNAIFLPPEESTSPATLRHETVHLVMQESAGDRVDYSPWLREGLAQVFERYDPAAGVGPGMDKELRVLLARTVVPDMDVARLVALQDYGVFTTVEPYRNYLEALVLAAYLFESATREQLRDYIAFEKRFAKGRPEAFMRIFASDAAAFRRGLAEYIRKAGQ